MDRRVVTAATLVVLALAGLATSAPGLGSLGGSPATTPVVAPSDGSSSSGAASNTGSAPFRLELLSVEECGTTCRDVTQRLHNQQDTAASGVSVNARIYAGNGTDSKLWEDDRQVGVIEAGGQTTSTERITLGPLDVAKLEANGGWVTIVVTVTSDRATVELTRRKDVR